MSNLEETLIWQLKAMKLPEPVREYPFAAIEVGEGKGVRQRLADAGLKNWRIDLAWPTQKLAVEVEGITHYGRNKNGTMKLGRHQTAKGMQEDLLKYDSAMRLGWCVYRCDGSMVKSGRAVETISHLLDLIGGDHAISDKRNPSLCRAICSLEQR